MERQFLLTCSDKFNENLMEFGLDKEKVTKNIFESIKQKEEDLEANLRRFFHSRYEEDGKGYILAGFVTKKEKAFLIEATSIWDKDPAQNIEVKEHGIRIER
jgi:hypothetical protein